MIINKETKDLIISLAEDIKEYHPQGIGDFQLFHIINYRLKTFSNIDLGENFQDIIDGVLNYAGELNRANEF